MDRSLSIACRCFSFFFKYFFWPCHKACGIFLNQGLNPCSLHWEHRDLITGPPGTSQLLFSKIIATCTSIYFHGEFQTGYLFDLTFPHWKEAEVHSVLLVSWGLEGWRVTDRTRIYVDLTPTLGLLPTLTRECDSSYWVTLHWV